MWAADSNKSAWGSPVVAGLLIPGRAKTEEQIPPPQNVWGPPPVASRRPPFPAPHRAIPAIQQKIGAKDDTEGQNISQGIERGALDGGSVAALRKCEHVQPIAEKLVVVVVVELGRVPTVVVAK